MKVELVQAWGSSRDIARAARTSYRGEGKTEAEDYRLVEYLGEHHHTGPFEFAGATMMIEAPIAVITQFLRHRTMSFNQESQRYKEPTFEFYIPDTFRANNKKNKQSSGESGDISQAAARAVYEASIKASIAAYKALIEAGVCREQARFVLPSGLTARLMISGNLNNWFRLLALRMHKDAQEETREYAIRMYDILKDQFPVACEVYENHMLPRYGGAHA